MGLVVLEGVVILVLVLTGFRSAVFHAVPNQLKVAKQCALTPRALRSLHIRCAYGRVLPPLLTPVPFAVTPRRGRCGRRF